MLELNKLGIDVAKSTVERYQPKGGRSTSPGWKTFLASHASELASMDFFVVPTAGLKVLFVLVILGHGRRRVLHANVTDHPTAEWTAQQLLEAFPFDTAPRYLVRDRDAVYGEKVRRQLRVRHRYCTGIAVAERVRRAIDRKYSARAARSRSRSK